MIVSPAGRPVPANDEFGVRQAEAFIGDLLESDGARGAVLGALRLFRGCDDAKLASYALRCEPRVSAILRLELVRRRNLP